MFTVLLGWGGGGGGAVWSFEGTKSGEGAERESEAKDVNHISADLR